MTKLVRRGRSYVIGETLDKLSTTFKDKVPKPIDIKKHVSKIIKKEPYFTPFIKKELGKKKTWL